MATTAARVPETIRSAIQTRMDNLNSVIASGDIEKVNTVARAFMNEMHGRILSLELSIERLEGETKKLQEFKTGVLDTFEEDEPGDVDAAERLTDRTIEENTNQIAESKAAIEALNTFAAKLKEYAQEERESSCNLGRGAYLLLTAAVAVASGIAARYY